MKTYIASIAFLVVFFLSVESTIAQSPPPPPPDAGNPSGGGGDGPVGAPIDGGLGILLALGGAYGARKIYQMRKEKREQQELDEEI